MDKKRLTINMLATVISFTVSMGISFLLSPYIIKNVGKEAYGFVGLANNFVTYAELITLALNSMAGRFITIKIHQKDKIGANKYFSSILLSNIIVTIIMSIPSLYIILNLDKIVNVPADIFNDVQLLWFLTFVNFFISLLTSTFGLATFVTNRLDLSSIRDIETNIIRGIMVLVIFSFFKASVWYIGLVSLVCTIIISGFNIYYKHKLLPDLKFKFKYFELRIVIELMKSGIWNVITKLGQILSDGLDLLIANLFIDAASMGVLSVAKTIPMAVSRLLSTISNVFSPQLTIHYAKNNIDLLVKDTKKSMVISGFFTNIALAYTIVFGYIFYQLWVPEEDPLIIQLVSILTVGGIIVPGAMNSLWGIFTITNRLKLNSLIIIGNGVLNTIIVFFLLKYTDLGILAIVGVSSLTSTIRNLTYTPIYAAHCLGIPKGTFYPPLIRYLLSTCVIIIIYIVLLMINPEVSWFNLILKGFISTLIGLIINYIILLNKDEKFEVNNIISTLKNKVFRGIERN